MRKMKTVLRENNSYHSNLEDTERKGHCKKNNGLKFCLHFSTFPPSTCILSSPLQKTPNAAGERVCWGCQKKVPQLWVAYLKSLSFSDLQKHHPDLCLHFHMVYFVCICLCPNFPFLQGLHSYWSRTDPDDLILTNLR